MHRHRHRLACRCGEALSLDQVPPGSSAVICALPGDEAYRERLRAMGLREGERVEVIKQAPLADPREYRVGGMHLSLRRAEARGISVGEVRSINAAEVSGISVGEVGGVNAGSANAAIGAGRRRWGWGHRSWPGRHGRGHPEPNAG